MRLQSILFLAYLFRLIGFSFSFIITYQIYSRCGTIVHVSQNEFCYDLISWLRLNRSKINFNKCLITIAFLLEWHFLGEEGSYLLLSKFSEKLHFPYRSIRSGGCENLIRSTCVSVRVGEEHTVLCETINLHKHNILLFTFIKSRLNFYRSGVKPRYMCDRGWW